MILWVEDDDRFLRIHKEALGKKGFQVNQVRTGSEAVCELQARGQEYNLVLLDVILPPGKDNIFLEEIQDEERGIEVLRELKYRGVTSLPPIVLLTARRPEIDLEELRKELPYQLGEMVGKPINVEQLIEVVKRYVSG